MTVLFVRCAYLQSLDIQRVSFITYRTLQTVLDLRLARLRSIGFFNGDKTVFKQVHIAEFCQRAVELQLIPVPLVPIQRVAHRGRW